MLPPKIRFMRFEQARARLEIQQALYFCRVPTAARKTRFRSRQSRNRRGGIAYLNRGVSGCFRACIPPANPGIHLSNNFQPREVYSQKLSLPANLELPQEGWARNFRAG